MDSGKWKQAIYMLMILSFAACSSNNSKTDTDEIKFVSGQVRFGPVVGASVKLYNASELNDSDLPVPVAETVSGDDELPEEAGRFEIEESKLEGSVFYILTASGGEDIDADDDGIRDDEPTPVNGTLHTLATGAQLLSGNFSLNILTETAYQRVTHLLADEQATTGEITAELDRVAAQLLNDINGDGIADNHDLVLWNPMDSAHLEALRTSSKQFVSQKNRIYSGENVNPGDLSMTRIIGSYDTDGSVQDIAVSGNYAYVADGPNGLVVLDASDPTALSKIGELALNGIALNILINETGNMAYIACGEAGLHVVDISDPANPVLLGTAVDSLGDTRYYLRLRLRFPYAFIVDSIQGLLVADVTDPSAPFIAGAYLTSNAMDVSIAGDYAFLANEILDISDPLNPAAAGTIDGSSLYGSAVYGDYLVTVISSGTDGMGLFDISDPASGVTPVSRYKSMETRDVRVYGNYAYVLCQGDSLPGVLESSVHIIDLSDPENLKLTGHFQDDQRTITQVTAHDGYLFLSRGNRGVEVLSQAMTAPTGMLGNYIPRNQLWRFEVSDKIAYLPQQSGSIPNFPIYPEFEIVDVSDPAQPKRIFRDGTTGCMLQEDIYVKGGYAYLLTADADAPSAASWGSLITYDVSEPGNPVVTDILDVPEGWSGIDGEGDYLYTSSNIIDISDPAHPVKMDGSTSTSGGSAEVQMWDSLMYWCDYRSQGTSLDWNFHIIDPYRAQRRGGIALEVGYHSFMDDVIYGFTISNGYAYVANNQAGMQILDLYDPELPELTGTYDTAGEVHDVSVHGRYAYIGDWADGVTVVDISDPYEPKYVTHFDCPMVNWIDIEEDDPEYIYAGGSAGLYIYPLLEYVIP